MKRKQLAAIILSAIMAVSACVPVNGISAAAAENAGAESTEALHLDPCTQEGERDRLLHYIRRAEEDQD